MIKRVIFYQTERGDTPARDFLRGLPEEARRKCGDYLRRIQDDERVSANVARQLEGPLWELRPEYNGIEYRLIYFVDGGVVIVILCAFSKKTQKTPLGEIEKARSRRLDYLRRKDYRDE